MRSDSRGAHLVVDDEDPGGRVRGGATMLRNSTGVSEM